jgi:hypothetical protein
MTSLSISYVPLAAASAAGSDAISGAMVYEAAKNVCFAKRMKMQG